MSGTGSDADSSEAESSELSDWEEEDVEAEAREKLGSKMTGSAKKKRKAATDRARREGARRDEQNAARRPPRTLAQCRQVDWARELVPLKSDDDGDGDGDDDGGIEQRDATAWTSKANALMTMAEHTESREWQASFVTAGAKHELTGENPQNTAFQVRGVCTSNTCSFGFDVRRAKRGGTIRWVLHKFADHSHECGGGGVAGGEPSQAGRRPRRTVFAAEQLAAGS